MLTRERFRQGRTWEPMTVPTFLNEATRRSEDRAALARLREKRSGLVLTEDGRPDSEMRIVLMDQSPLGGPPGRSRCSRSARRP